MGESEEAVLDNVRESLAAQGYAVVAGAVPAPMCEAVLTALVDVLGIDIDDEATWGRIGTDLDMVPMWGHQSQWEIRQLPLLHRVWSALWERTDLWADINSCRITPPWQPGNADALPIHFDVDPHDATLQWFPGLVALSDTPAGHGGFRCVPSLYRDRERWPTTWPAPGEFQPPLDSSDQIVEVPMRMGDLLIWDSHLPHGTVRNCGTRPRAVLYLQQHPPGTDAELAERLREVTTGAAPQWVRWKPGHDRLDHHPLTLTEFGSRLLGTPGVGH